MNVYGIKNKASPNPTGLHIDRFFDKSDLLEMAKLTDYLILVAPQTSETNEIVNSGYFKNNAQLLTTLQSQKNIASNRLEDWLEEDEDINQNLDFKGKSFYNDDREIRSFSNKKEDDPWI